MNITSNYPLGFSIGLFATAAIIFGLPKLRAERVKPFLKMFTMQFFMYCIVCISYRALALANYPVTFCTDLAYAALGFYVIKAIAKDESRWGQAGYILGGAFGSLAAIWITTHLWGK